MSLSSKRAANPVSSPPPNATKRPRGDNAKASAGGEDAAKPPEKADNGDALGRIFVAVRIRPLNAREREGSSAEHATPRFSALDGTRVVETRPAREDDAFDALFEAATEVYRAKETEDDTPSRERIYDACLLACCDAHESRSSLGLESRVDAARFAEAAAETLHGEMDDEAATSRRRATAELDAIETLSMVDHEDHEGQNDHKDHVTPLILRAALETKMRARGVDARGVGDENEKTKSGVNKKSGVFFPVVEAKRAVDEVVADGLLAGSGAAGARAAARFFEVSEERRGVDECVADMVRVAFARRAKSRVDAAVAAAAARASAAASARAAITLRRDAFETSRLSAARARALDAYAARLRVALETVAATAEPVSAFRGAVSLVETFAATSALVGGFPSRQGLDASMTFFDADDPEDRASGTSLGVYAGVLVPGARASSRALRVVHASPRSRRKTGSEMRAWEGNAWPSVGIARTEGPLVAVAEWTSPSSFLAPRVVDADDELVVPVFASVSRKTSSDRSLDTGRGDDFDGLAAFERFERFDAVYQRGFTKEEEAGFLSEFPDPDVSETPAGFLALEFGFRKEEIINEETARRRRSVVLLAARAAGVAPAAGWDVGGIAVSVAVVTTTVLSSIPGVASSSLDGVAEYESGVLSVSGGQRGIPRSAYHLAQRHEWSSRLTGGGDHGGGYARLVERQS